MVFMAKTKTILTFENLRTARVIGQFLFICYIDSIQMKEEKEYAVCKVTTGLPAGSFVYRNYLCERDGAGENTMQ